MNQLSLWSANLELQFSYNSALNKTMLTHRKHEGPLRVQKALWPEKTGVCHAIILHPPAGIAGGDALDINIKIQSDAHAVLTTPGAGKWYGSDGRKAFQNITLTVEKNATLEWLPQEIILFDSALAQSATTVYLDDTASFIGWDILVFGRQSRLEQFANGHYQNHMQIWQNDQVLIDDVLNITGGGRWFTSPLGMNGKAILGTLWAVPPVAYKDITILDAHIEQIRDLITRMQYPIHITRLNTMLLARYIGNDAQQALAGFAGIRAKLRRLWLGLDEEYLRIWKT